MYRYKIGYHSYEDSHYFEVDHHLKFSKNDIDTIILTATKNILKKEPQTHHGFDSISFELMKELKQMGFREIEFEVEWSVFGWASLFQDDWTGDDENLNMLRKGLNQAGFSKWDDIMFLMDIRAQMWHICPGVWDIDGTYTKPWGLKK